MVIFYLLILISLIQIPCIIASHFRGGLLTWTAENASQVSMIRYGIDLFFELHSVSRIFNTLFVHGNAISCKHVCFLKDRQS